MSREIDEKSHRSKISRRAILLLGAQLAGIGALGARAKYLQIDRTEHYAKLADENRIDYEIEPAPRGEIYDIKGVPLAKNVHDFRVDIDVSEVSDPKLVLDNLANVIQLSPLRQAELLRVINDARERSVNAVYNIADHLSWEQFSLVNENLPVLEGVKPKIARAREYPYGELMAHQVGYVGRVSDRDIKNMTSVPAVYYTPNMAIGKTGIEAKMEDELRGIEEKTRVEKNAHRRVVRKLDSKSAIPGRKLQLTLDARLQHYAMERLKGESGSAVIVDIKTGDVKLLASTPSFDPNSFVLGISHKEYNALLNDKYFPLNHKAVHGVYPPGSTFKMVTALAALETGAVGPNDYFTCRGKINRGRDFWCWKSSGHGAMNMRNSLKHSCDVYYYNIGERSSIDNISKIARKLGLDERYQIPQSAISKGLIPDRDWKKEVKDDDWVVGDTFNASIGQGFVLATPLQLAIMTARIASGKIVKPNMIASIEGKPVEREPMEQLDIRPENLDVVRQGMYAVCNENRGTAYKTRINAGGRRWAGKTGTSQVVAISKAERERGIVKNEDRVWERRDHALFVAYAPYDDPQYAISVIVEHGGGGSTTAAPIARDLMLYALYDDKPPLSAYPAGRGKAANFWRNAASLESRLQEVEEEETAQAGSTNDHV